MNHGPMQTTGHKCIVRKTKSRKGARWTSLFKTPPIPLRDLHFRSIQLIPTVIFRNNSPIIQYGYISKYHNGD